jgi:hypothetical protein
MDGTEPGRELDYLGIPRRAYCAGYEPSTLMNATCA